jgi:hypothetical protein
MTDNDDHTQAAEPETTEVEPSTAAAPQRAWSVDIDASGTHAMDPPPWHGRAVTAGLAVLVASVAGVSIWLAATGFKHSGSKPIEPSHVPTTTNTLTAAPPPPAPVALPPTATTLPAPSPYASLVGKWFGHHRGLTVSPDGTIELEIPDEPACPQCSGATMPPATIHIGLTSYDAARDGTPDSSGKFFGYVKDSSDTRVIPTAVPVEVDVMNASEYSYLGNPPDYSAPGRVLTVSINGDHVGARNEGHQLGDPVPFCDAAAEHKGVCGA